MNGVFLIKLMVEQSKNELKENKICNNFPLIAERVKRGGNKIVTNAYKVC